MTHLELFPWLTKLQNQLLSEKHRGMVILSGDYAWGNLLTAQLIDAYQQQNEVRDLPRIVYWGNENTVCDTLRVKNYRHHLGRENDLVIFADNNFHPDAFAALSGTLVAGGVLIWLCPENIINNKADLFIQRIWSKVQNNQKLYIFSQSDKNLPSLPSQESREENVQQPIDSECKTIEQQQAVHAIEKVASGHRKRPLVLTADRGRGKSSALAIAVAKRMTVNKNTAQQDIIITAPHLDALKVFFKQLTKSCPQGELIQSCFCYKEHRVRFLPVDVLLKEKPTTSLLLIDEAAAIPVSILSTLVDHYHRLVFSSTQHGYEGAGRGFAIKFKEILQKKTPDYNQLHIQQPIRWAKNDVLEAFIFDAFLLKCETVAGNSLKQEESGSLRYELISQQQLIKDENLLQQVFAVLITAHYQTSPSDLKLLLNNPAVRLFIVRQSNNVLAVSLTLIEGNASKQEVADVSQSKKRLKSQLLPQSLFLYNHCHQAFDYQYLRIMRIAVLPAYQQQGIGLKLLAEIEQYAINHRIDMLGTSFGATQSLLKFWANADFKIIRLGGTIDKASGENSAIYVLPVSEQAKSLVDDLQIQFYQQFTYLLTEQYQAVKSSVVRQIIQQWPVVLLPVLSEYDHIAIDNYITKNSLLDTSIYSLHKYLIRKIALSENNTPRCSSKLDENCMQVSLLINKLLQKQTFKTLALEFSYTGKKQVEQALHKAISDL